MNTPNIRIRIPLSDFNRKFRSAKKCVAVSCRQWKGTDITLRLVVRKHEELRFTRTICRPLPKAHVSWIRNGNTTEFFFFGFIQKLYVFFEFHLKFSVFFGITTQIRTQISVFLPLVVHLSRQTNYCTISFNWYHGRLWQTVQKNVSRFN